MDTAPLESRTPPPAATGISPADRRALRVEIVRLAWPAILEFSLHQTVWLADVAFVGRLGAGALSAAGLGGQTYFLLLFMFESVGIAATAMVARRVGSGDVREASSVAAQIAGLGLLLGLLTTGLVWVLSPWVFRISGLGPEIGALGITYQRIIALGAPSFLFRSALAGAVRGFGDTRSSMFVAAVAGLFNIVGDWVLVFGKLGFPALGIGGAAAASAASHVLGTLLMLGMIARRLTPARIELDRLFRFGRETLRTIARIAAPASGENLLTDLARTVGIFAVARLGAGAMAAHEVTAAAEGISFMPGFGFAIATSVMVGQSLGRGRPDLARAAAGEGLRVATGFGLAMAAVFLAFAPQLVGIFTPDPAVRATAAGLLRIAALAQPLIAVQNIYGGALRGAGDTRSPLLASGVTSWGVRVVITYVAVVFLGLPVAWAWWAMTIDWAAKAVWLWVIYRRGRWQREAV